MDPILLISGAGVSVLVQLFKKYAGTDKTATLAALVALCLVAGAGSWYLKHAGLWDSLLQIVASSGAFYAFIIKNIEDSLK